VDKRAAFMYVSVVSFFIFMMHAEIKGIVEKLASRGDAGGAFRARQLIFSVLPPSYFVENYLYDNEGRLQNLTDFTMLKCIYDNMPQKLLLKCSRKTLKSTLLSNFICLNLVRWNFYKMLYIGPQEMTVKYFSSNYLPPRFESPKVKNLLVQGWAKNDVFEKIVQDTKSSLLLRYVKDDATRIRGPAVDCVVYDEVQDIQYDQIPIIQETMALSPYKREIFAGTPLDSGNTIHNIWRSSNQLEWMMRCGCGHWNSLTEGNEPLKMILVHGLSCAKCSKKINSREGEWVSMNPTKALLTGYHLAQPILPFFNETEKEWKEIYVKCTSGKYDHKKIMNEVFGLTYDVGTKPITQEELQKLCILGPMGDLNNLKIYNQNRQKYKLFTVGVDWGVSMTASRTVCTVGAMTVDGTFEVIFVKIFTGFDHEAHIKTISEVANMLGAYCVSDSGPDPIRGIKLCELTNPNRSQLAAYRRSKVIQYFDQGEYDWRQNRWVLHRSDVISLMIRQLKAGKILFPNWEDVSDYMQDILNVYVEVKDGLYGQEMFYGHKDSQPDDAMHSLVFAACAGYMAIGDISLLGPSSSAKEI
jgi:hypothetical protein